MPDDGPTRPDQPGRRLEAALADWLAGPRSRALRRATVGQRQSALEIGSGHGTISAELSRRVAGELVCSDLDASVLRAPDAPDAFAVAADCRALPFADASFDLVFSENTLLWVAPPERAIAEAARVLMPGGALVAVEPDYGGMLEHPDLGLRQAWLAGLSEAGADPLVGRKLPGACEAVGLSVWVETAHLPRTADPAAVELLAGLPLSAGHRAAVDAAAERIAAADGRWSVFLHVPYLLVVAARPESP